MKISKLVVKVKEVQKQMQKLVKKLDEDVVKMEKENQQTTCYVEEQFPQYNAYIDVATPADLANALLAEFLRELDKNANVIGDLEF